MYFVGEHEHRLDAKNRVILPAEYRDSFEAGGYLTRLLDGCLALYTADEFQRVAADVIEKARRGPNERAVARTFAAGAKQVEPDKHGRLTIPDKLKRFAQLTEEVVFIGQFNRIEIWDREQWSQVEELGEAGLRTPGSDVGDLGI